jgi:hypothetical protein
MPAFALQAAAAFNLVCTGTYTTEPSFATGAAASAEAPFTIIYRIDLDRALYCAGDCVLLEPLAEVTDNEILLRNSAILSGFEDGTVIAWNRGTGQYIGRAVGVNTVRYFGRCERAPFTGFRGSRR